MVVSVRIDRDHDNVTHFKKSQQSNEADLQFNLVVLVDSRESTLRILEYFIGLQPLEEQGCLDDEQEVGGDIIQESVECPVIIDKTAIVRYPKGEAYEPNSSEQQESDEAEGSAGAPLDLCLDLDNDVAEYEDANKYQENPIAY